MKKLIINKYKLYNFINKYKYLLIVIVISCAVYFRWLSFGVYNYFDHYFSFSETIKNAFSFGSWSGFSLGSINNTSWRLLGPDSILYSFFGYFGFDSNIAEKFLWLCPLIFLSAISSYFLIKKITDSEIGGLVGSFVFCFNTYFLSINNAGHFLISLSSVFSVVAIIFFIELLEKRKTKLIILTTLFLFLSSVSDFRILYITVWVLFFYFLYYLLVINEKTNKQCLLCGSFPVFILFILNIFWILPSLNTGTLTENSILSRSLWGDEFYDILKSITLFYPFWTGTKIDWFVNQNIPLHFWLIPIFSFFGLILNKKNNKILFFGLITLIGIFLSKQAGGPFPNVYPWLFDNFFGFSAFREASKFNFLVVIGYSVLIGSFISYIWDNFNKNKFQNFIKYLCLILISLIFFWNTKPIISGEIKATYTPKEIPSDYLIFRKFITNQNNYFRTFWDPSYTLWSFYSLNNPRVGAAKINQEVKNYEIFFQNYENLSINQKTNIFFSFKISNNFFDILSIKYIIVPIEDIENNIENKGGPFFWYGGKEDSNIRQWYIDELDKIEWLKKIDIGTKELVVYENENYKPYIRSANNLYRFEDFNNLEGKYEFINNYLGNNFDFVIKDETKNSNKLTCLFSLFEETKNKEINQEKLSISENINISQNNINSFYNSQTAKEIFYKKYNNEIFVYIKSTGDLFWDNQNVNVFKAQEKILARQIIDLNKEYYFKINDQIIKASNYTGVIGKVKKGDVLEIYSLDNNLINNPSFETGSWQEKVGDCNNYDDNRILAMSLNANVKSDGEQSLQLEATRHIACINQRFKVEPGEYVFSFDYQSNNADKAGFYLSLNDENKTIIKDNLVIDGNEWQTHNQLITIPDGVNFARLHIYAYESDKIKNNTVRYDNFFFGKLNLEQSIGIRAEAIEYKKIDLSFNGNENVFEYKDINFNYKNLISNPSFESGFWKEKVGDCHNYDNNPVLAINLNKDLKSDGEQSLQLEATRHIACTSIGQLVKSGSNYLFSFDYQSDNAKQAGYYLGFNDSEKTKISEKIDIENSEWKTIEKNIKVPEGATKMSIYLYAYETDGKINNIVRYDNFKLIELPDLTDRFYLVSEPKEKLIEPKETNFELINPTKKLIHIKGATTPFFLAMSESYHAQWELQMNNEKIQGLLDSWWPFAKRQKVNDEYHYKLANFLNAWYVDPQALCENNNSACKINEDGSYDIEMVAEFWPQRWFYFGLLISGTTLIGCVGYLGYDFIRERKRKKQKEKIKIC